MQGLRTLGIAIIVAKLKEIAPVPDHWLRTDATIIEVDERYVPFIPGVSTPAVVSIVKVCFTDAGGRSVHAQYSCQPVATGLRKGQMIQITYDPEKPTDISPIDN